MPYWEQPVYIDPLLVLRGLCAFGVLLHHCSGSSNLAFRWYLEHAWEFGETSRVIISALMSTTGKNFVLFFFVFSGYPMGKVFLMGGVRV